MSMFNQALRVIAQIIIVLIILYFSFVLIFRYKHEIDGEIQTRKDALLIKTPKLCCFKIIRKINFLFKKLCESKANWLFLVLFSFSISFIFYYLLSLPLGSVGVNLYQPDAAYSYREQLQSIGKEFVNSWNSGPIVLFGQISSILIITIAFILACRKKLNFKNAIFLIILLGIVVRITYGNYTDNIFTRQHDVWSLNYNGHYAITMHIYEYGDIPPLFLKDGVPSLSDSFQFYHPKYAYYLYAIAMHINSFLLGTTDTWILYQSIRIFTIGLSIIQLVVSYKIFKELSSSKIVQLVGTAFIAFAPFLIRASAMSNNDPVLWFFIYLSVYFAIRWWKKQNYINTIALALSIGLAMGSKTSGALIAVPIGAMFIIKFIQFIKNKTLLKKIPMFIVFFLVCCPIGLYWIVYNYVEYNQPIGYVFSNLNRYLAIDESKSFFDRFLSLPFNEYFKTVFVQLWNNNTNVSQDYNIYIAMMKSSIFGEFSYRGGAYIFAVLLYVWNFVFVCSLILFFAYFVILWIVEKKFGHLLLIAGFISFYLSGVFFLMKNTLGIIVGILFLLIVGACIYLFIRYKLFKRQFLPLIFIASVTISFLLFFVYFNVSMPWACTMDFRYLGIIYLGGGFMLGLAFEHASKQKNKLFILAPTTTALVLYLFSSMQFYLSIG